jgi:hypothetical protein
VSFAFDENSIITLVQPMFLSSDNDAISSFLTVEFAQAYQWIPFSMRYSQYRQTTGNASARFVTLQQ